MKKKQNLTLVLVFVGLMGLLTLSGCSKDDDPSATVNITATGSDLDGDVTGDGGSTSRNYTWNNPLSRADWNMDITATNGGSFQLIIEDADGVVVLDRTLVAGQGEDSGSGVTQAGGTPGDWTVTINLTNFNGDGSFSLSPE